MLLALVAGALGLALAYTGSKALIALAPANVPRLDEAALDGPVLAFACLVSMMTSLLCGLVPALHAVKIGLNETLKQGGTRTIGGGAGHTREVLVASQIALCVMLVTGAGLLIKSFIALSSVSLGFQPENVLVMRGSCPSTVREDPRRANQYFKDVLARVGSIAGRGGSGRDDVAARSRRVGSAIFSWTVCPRSRMSTARVPCFPPLPLGRSERWAFPSRGDATSPTRTISSHPSLR